MKSWRAAVPITVYHMEKAVKGESGNILLPFVILLLLFSIFPLGLCRVGSFNHLRQKRVAGSVEMGYSTIGR